MTDFKYVQFLGGPKDGEVWRAPISERWIPMVGWVPKHQKIRHCYRLQKQKGEEVYVYQRAEERAEND